MPKHHGPIPHSTGPYAHQARPSYLMDGWRSIETAPQNHERVLVSAGRVANPGALDVVIAWQAHHGVWLTDGGGQYMGPKWWQPLPEAPL